MITDPILITALSLLVVSVAYFIKGFSGFGPALTMIPFFTIFYDAQTAIKSATLFDMIASIVLITTVFKRLDWKFILPVLALFFPGAYLGVYFMNSLSLDSLQRIIGAGLLVFVIILFFFERNGGNPIRNKKYLEPAIYPVAFLSGFGGGLIGISGPLLVIYMKFMFDKTYFRDQLIAIFTFGAFWRYFLYQSHNISMNISSTAVMLMIVIMLAALWTGSHLHLRINEKKFNQTVAVILIIPAIRLLV